MRVLALTLVLAACATALPGEPGGIAPGSYRLLAVNGAPPQGSASLVFATDGSFVGEGPCNQHRGRNTAAAPGFRAEGVASTRRACLWEAGEGEYVRALTEANRITASGPVLGLAGPGGTLEFTRE